ncbi:hypothetical protein JCM10908_002970 [Rhodotorula pacifica]|uniref:alpha/beta fold hydrolase n=1 Tax=Rhodotorula pacifica TaxID=1495444 RepID=UPI003179DBB5
MDDPLPAAYRDPDGFLHDPVFHRTTTYAEDCPTGPLTVSYAVAGSADVNAPVVVWINGMGGHRLAACLLDGKFTASGVRLITVDRPSAGKSTPVPLADRVRLSHEALLAVLAAENITRFSLLSHSNGVIYTLYTLLNLPDHLTVPSWTLSSPWVPPFLSGSTLLSIASWIPSPLTARLGGFVSGLQRVLGPLDAGLGWSTGVVRGMTEWSSGFVSMGTHAPSTPTTALSSSAASSESASALQGAASGSGANATPGAQAIEPELLTPEKQRERFRRNNAKRPYHKKLFGGEYVPPGMFNEGMKIALAEGLDAMGLEAIMCLRQGDGANWGWVDASEPRDEMQLYARGFGRLRDAMQGEEEQGARHRTRTPLRMSVWYGTEDGLIPQRGREYLRRLLCSELGMVADEDWHEIKGAGHDDPLGLTCVIEPFLEQVIEAYRSLDTA